MRYEFLIAGAVPTSLMAAFPELATTRAPVGRTALHGAVDNASRMSELLSRFADLGITVMEVRQLPERPPVEEPRHRE